jgi:hypothetical protein
VARLLTLELCAFRRPRKNRKVGIANPSVAYELTTGMAHQNAGANSNSRIALSGRHQHPPRCADDLEAGSFEHADEASSVGPPPPRPTPTVEIGDRAARVQQREERLHRIEYKQLTPANSSNAGQTSNGIAEVH